MVTNKKINTWIKNLIKYLKIYNKGCNGTQMSRFDTSLVQQQIYNKSTMLSFFIFIFNTHHFIYLHLFYIYIFSRRFYPKRLTGYTFFCQYF